MIKVRFLILLALLNFSIDSSAQSSIRKMSDCYKINGMICQQNLLQIENVSDENIWIFFEPDTTLTDNELILSRFKYKGEGDMSLYQWITDGNVNWGNLCPELDSLFFKILTPNQKFNIVYIGDNIECFDEISQKLRIITNSEIRQIYKPLSQISATDPPAFQPDVIVFRQ
jgi:hypothetical protein